jgi:hypothetical protein
MIWFKSLIESAQDYQYLSKELVDELVADCERILEARQESGQ